MPNHSPTSEERGRVSAHDSRQESHCASFCFSFDVFFFPPDESTPRSCHTVTHSTIPPPLPPGERGGRVGAHDSRVGVVEREYKMPLRQCKMPHGLNSLILRQARAELYVRSVRVTMCCSELQHVAVCYMVLQCIAVSDPAAGARWDVCTSVLHCVAVCCSVLQRVAACCSVLQCVAASDTVTGTRWDVCTLRVCTLCVCCSVLQYMAVCCSVMQRVAVSDTAAGAR